MTPNGRGTIEDPANSSSWFTSEVQLLQGQMSMLQTALESSKHAVEEFHRRAAENLQASEQRYHDLFNNVLTGIYRMAPDGRLTLANPALVRMLGYNSFDELASRRLAPPWRLVAAANAAHLIGFERSWKKKNGDTITVRESCRVVRGADLQVEYYEGVVEDITGQKKAETFEHDCRSLLETVARNEPLEQISNQLVRLLERQMPGASCSLLLARGEEMCHAAGCQLPIAFVRRLAERLSSDQVGHVSGHATIRNKAEIAENILVHPGWQGILEDSDEPALRSCWTMPVVSGRGAMLGAIAVCRTQPHSPDYAEMQIVETTSRLAGLAIEHRHLYEDLERQAMRDRLTDLPNRVYFEERLASAIERAGDRQRLALVWIDLDRFKEINDTLGHQIGDELIRLVALRLLPAVRGRSVVARTGGDEFAVLMPDCENDSEVALYAQELLDCLQAPFQINGCEIFVTASVGVAVYPDHGQTATELQQNADAAMYEVKSRGRDGIGFYEAALGDGIRERMELANSLRRAVERNELELHYQPQVDFDGNLRGLEALLRWKHPLKGTLMPGHFIDIAEETGLIVPIGAWVLEEACRRCAEWNAERTEPIVMAVNVSSLQFYFSDLLEVVQRALAKTGLAPSCLEIELTESLLMRDAHQSSIELQKLRSLGVTIAVDDFGTGYSSLSYLQRLPVDLLKIDRSFLEHIDSKSAFAVVQAITALAHALNLRVVAEGVEKEHQMTMLRHMGVDLAQGYLIGRPVPQAVTGKLLQQWAAPVPLIA